jgi:hypothetical protein
MGLNPRPAAALRDTAPAARGRTRFVRCALYAQTPDHEYEDEARGYTRRRSGCIAPARVPYAPIGQAALGFAGNAVLLDDPENRVLDRGPCSSA